MHVAYIWCLHRCFRAFFGFLHDKQAVFVWFYRTDGSLVSPYISRPVDNDTRFRVLRSIGTWDLPCFQGRHCVLRDCAAALASKSFSLFCQETYIRTKIRPRERFNPRASERVALVLVGECFTVRACRFTYYFLSGQTM